MDINTETLLQDYDRYWDAEEIDIDLANKIISSIPTLVSKINKASNKSETRPTWNHYFNSIASLISSRSTCERLQVGAVIVKDNLIIASGYNGSLPGEEHCDDPGVGCLIGDHGGCQRTQHAERNALAQCSSLGISTEGASIYVTHFPCLDCTKQIIQSGLKHVYYQHDYKNSEYAIVLLERSGVTCRQISN